MLILFNYDKNIMVRASSRALLAKESVILYKIVSVIKKIRHFIQRISKQPVLLNSRKRTFMHNLFLLISYVLLSDKEIKQREKEEVLFMISRAFKDRKDELTMLFEEVIANSQRQTHREREIICIGICKEMKDTMSLAEVAKVVEFMEIMIKTTAEVSDIEKEAVRKISMLLDIQ